MNSSTGLKRIAPKRLLVSRDDREFNVESNSWRLNKNISIRVDWISDINSPLSDSIRNVLAAFAVDYAAETTKSMNYEARSYFLKTGDAKFRVDSLISLRSMLLSTEEYRLSNIRLFVKKWFELGYPGVDREVVDLLTGWRLKGSEKGKAIKRLDPEEGPLTEIEMSALIDAMLQAYLSGQISLSDYALSTLLVYTGRRPIQITSLKIKDICSRKTGEVDEYWINFPRAKQRFSKWRTEFNAYPITEDLWSLLSLHASKISEKTADLVGGELTGQIVQELPLFPDFDAVRECKNTGELSAASLGDELHAERDLCNEVMKELEKQLDVYSERTGKRLNLSTRRFRYTLGSNIAREGKGELIIAEALDHSDTQNVGVYVKNLPDVVERIDRAVALELAPLAQAFQGVLIESETEAERGDDKSSRIGNAEVNVGNCGSYGFCGAMAPIACYTCRHFQPWVDGPHEIILDELIDKRDQVLRNTQDIKVASSNDRLILAVAQVIRRCNAKKAERLQLEQC
ncbi:MAG: DNA breaking-rejoining enzyme [Spongiibacteraceae bacterium]|mgnify:CR=1 FL=1|jgi:integrase|nr:DNA breaking-rejoining enzyme [Spongiibacteraceae bacterium]|tara:strand:- start:190 stop:1734 length:1545 start_codon:yes stop_codon:yes gene_type:complete